MPQEKPNGRDEQGKARSEGTGFLHAHPGAPLRPTYFLKTLKTNQSPWNGGDSISFAERPVQIFTMCFYLKGFGLSSQIFTSATSMFLTRYSLMHINII